MSREHARLRKQEGRFFWSGTRCLLGALCFAGPITTGNLRAELRWSQTEISLAAKSTDKVARADFVFNNAGTTSVSIASVQPDCTCVTVPLAKKVYLPGESGQVTAEFKVGGQSGEHTVPIQVQSREGEGATSTILLLRVKIVEVVILSQRFLYWKANEPLDPKPIVVTLLPGEPITLRGVRASNPDFRVELTPTDNPRVYRLLVTPPADRKKALSSISLAIQNTDTSENSVQTLVARLL